MCCVAKENICFFLSSRLFFCYFDGLIVLLKSFSSSAGTSYALCLRKLRYRHNLFLPLAWPTKRGRELPVEKDFGKSASCHFSVYRPYFLRYGFQQDNFSELFPFGIFFLEAVVKAALFVVGEVGAIQVVINPSPVYLRHLRLVWQSRRKKVHACPSQQARKADIVPFLFRLCLL